VLSFFSRSLLALKQTKSFFFFNEQKRRRTKTTHEEDKVHKNLYKKATKTKKQVVFGSSLFSPLFSSFSLFETLLCLCDLKN